MLVENKRGNYSFLKGIAPYSAGVVAEAGFAEALGLAFFADCLAIGGCGFRVRLAFYIFQRVPNTNNYEV